MAPRRTFLKQSFAAAAALSAGRLALAETWQPAELPAGTIDSSSLETIQGKVPLIKRSYRPPNYETPVEYFNQPYTPNNAFFVRYHLSNIPSVDGEAWRLTVEGEAAGGKAVYSLADLRRTFEVIELAAVCQCSGNRRGLFQPHVYGVEWGYGAMGNARWVGVRLRDVLNKVGVNKDALEVVLDGADMGVTEKTPDFQKSIPIWKALDENTLIAFQMNGAPLPHWNGFPARLIVPGWTGTYWMKHLTSVKVVPAPYKGFWMASAYRIPLGKFPSIDRFTSQDSAVNTPITEMVVNSLVTNLKPGQTVPANRMLQIQGVAWDSGAGISEVAVSVDGGREWRPAELLTDLGRYAWRGFTFAHTPKPGRFEVLVKASNRAGETQTPSLILNPAGYHHNVVQRLPLVAA